MSPHPVLTCSPSGLSRSSVHIFLAQHLAPVGSEAYTALLSCLPRPPSLSWGPHGHSLSPWAKRTVRPHWMGRPSAGGSLLSAVLCQLITWLSPPRP